MPYCRKDEEIRLKSAQFGLGSWVTTFPGKQVYKQVFTKNNRFSKKPHLRAADNKIVGRGNC